MGGERASKTRQRLAGKICCRCSNPMDAPPWPGERYCARCDPANAPRTISVTFSQVAIAANQPARWLCHFAEADLRTPAGRSRTFASDERLTEMIERGGGLKSLADRQALEQGIRQGHGRAVMRLTPDQYARLKK